MHKRMVFQQWIVELGRDPSRPPENTENPESAEPPEADSPTESAVWGALARLAAADREFTVRFYFMGWSYHDLARLTGRPVPRLKARHKRIRRQLRVLLRPFVMPLLNRVVRASCPICASEYRSQIDAIIAHRDQSRPWRPILRRLREDFDLHVSSAQVLLGHERYHMPSITTHYPTGPVEKGAADG